MQRTFITFILTTFFACNEQTNQNNSTKPTNDTNNVSDTSKKSGLYNSQLDSLYRFDNTATVNGCTEVYLQKISKDLQYELLIELKFDSIPKFKEIDINKYSQFVNIYFNKYSNGNNYINGICDDRIDINAKPVTKYSASSGSLTITYISDKGFIISALTKNLVLRSEANDKIVIPFEFFDKLHVGWKGG